jgi:hypothetical protein
LLQVTFALSHACIKLDLYAKSNPKTIFSLEWKQFIKFRDNIPQYNPSGMCCPLILCRYDTTSEAEDPKKCQRLKSKKDDMTKGWEREGAIQETRSSWIDQATRLAE